MEIKELRDHLKLTQEKLARELGVSLRTVANWESGKARPSQLAQKQLARLARKHQVAGC